jgi:indole-3-acetate monooxygenase
VTKRGDVVDTNSVMKGIEDLLPTIRARRDEIEQARKLPRDLVDELAKTGVFSLLTPKDLGGLQAPPMDLMRAIEAVSSADGSTGWCTMIAAGNNIAAGFVNAAGAKEVFADPVAPKAGIAAPIGAAVRVDGGLQVTGRWPFASGITHCEWLFAGAIVMEDGKPHMTPHGPEIVHVFMPVAEVEIHDTWYVSGLCGTGSNDFSTKDAFVPAQRIFSLFDPSGHRPDPLYQLPAVAGFVCNLACVSLGIGRAALDELTELAPTKTPAMSFTVMADKAVAQIELARAEAALGSARSFMFETMGDLWRTASAGGEVTKRQNVMVRIAAAHAVETGNAVAGMANTFGGSSSIYSKSSLQRHARDAEAVTHHFSVTPHLWEDAGRVLLGRDPLAPIF